MDIIYQNEDLLGWVFWDQSVFAFANVQLLNLKPETVHGQVGSHWDRHHGYGYSKLLLKSIQDDSLRTRLRPNQSHVLI